ncbi:MAG: hypothetical protein ABSH01_19450 [Terriglobia bacterium]|jgi:hypothetical protein
MFVELMPLLAGRTVLITVAKVDDKTILPTRSSVICGLESRPWAVGGTDTDTPLFAHPW